MKKEGKKKSFYCASREADKEAKRAKNRATRTR